MPEPKITVLMPAYNAGKYIGEAIASVLAQTFTDFELMIVNDGSTDDTLEAIGAFADERIVVIHQSNQGVAAALNKGLKYARAAYIARFDADDICYPQRLQTQYDFMLANPAYSIVGSEADYIDTHGEFLFTHQLAAYSSDQITALPFDVCPMIHSCVMYKKEAVVAAGGYNEHAYTFEDHFLWAGMLMTQKACNLPQALIKVRLNPESVTIDEKWHTQKFRSIKNTSLKTQRITADEGAELQQIGSRQYSPKNKQGAYYALCGKKFLLNNYQPQKARHHMARAIALQPLRLDNYLLYTISYLPQPFINWLHINLAR